MLIIFKCLSDYDSFSLNVTEERLKRSYPITPENIDPGKNNKHLRRAAGRNNQAKKRGQLNQEPSPFLYN